MRRFAAFTLIELLVVIAIIALLIAILLPSLAYVRESSRTTICGNQVRQIAMAFNQYCQANKDNFPETRKWAGQTSEYKNIEKVREGQLYPYISAARPATNSPPTAAEKVFLCPTWGRFGEPGTVRNYSANANIGDCPDGPRHLNLKKLSEIKAPNKMLLVTEENTWTNSGRYQAPLNDANLFGNEDPPNGPDVIGSYHMNLANKEEGWAQVSFVDTHVNRDRWFNTRKLVQGERYPW